MSHIHVVVFGFKAHGGIPALSTSNLDALLAMDRVVPLVLKRGTSPAFLATVRALFDPQGTGVRTGFCTTFFREPWNPQKHQLGDEVPVQRLTEANAHEAVKYFATGYASNGVGVLYLPVECMLNICQAISTESGNLVTLSEGEFVCLVASINLAFGPIGHFSGGYQVKDLETMKRLEGLLFPSDPPVSMLPGEFVPTRKVELESPTATPVVAKVPAPVRTTNEPPGLKKPLSAHQANRPVGRKSVKAFEFASLP